MNNFREFDVKSERLNYVDLIADKWMLISAQKDDKVNTMTASWGMMGELWGKEVSQIFIRPSRYTLEFVENSQYYSLCFFDGDIKEKLSYLGRVSGRGEDKIRKAGLNVRYDEKAPYFDEARYVIICRKLYKDQIRKENFTDADTFGNVYKTDDVHFSFIGEIVKALKR